MKVHEVMSAQVTTASPKTPFRELWKAIFQQRIHAIPVVDAKKKVIGIVAEEDLLKPLYPDYQQFIEDFVSASDFEEMEEKIHDLVKLKAEHVMCRKVIFTRADTPIMRALSRMIVRNVRQLPVLAEGDIIVGMVSKGDVFDTLFKRHLTKHTIQHKKSSSKKSKKK